MLLRALCLQDMICLVLVCLFHCLHKMFFETWQAIADWWHKCWLKGKLPILPSNLTLKSELSFHFKLLLKPIFKCLEENYLHSVLSWENTCISSIQDIIFYIFIILYYENIFV